MVISVFYGAIIKVTSNTVLAQTEILDGCPLRTARPVRTGCTQHHGTLATGKDTARRPHGETRRPRVHGTHLPMRTSAKHLSAIPPWPRHCEETSEMLAFHEVYVLTGKTQPQTHLNTCCVGFTLFLSSQVKSKSQRLLNTSLRQTHRSVSC